MTIYAIKDNDEKFICYRTDIGSAISYAESLQELVYTDNKTTQKTLQDNFDVVDVGRFTIVPIESDYSIDEITKKYFIYINPNSHELLDISWGLLDPDEDDGWKDYAMEDECGIYEIMILNTNYADALTRAKEIYREETGHMIVVGNKVKWEPSYRDIICTKLDDLGVRYSPTLSTDELYRLLVANGDSGII